MRMMDCAHLDKALILPAEKTATPFTMYPNFVTRLVDLRRVSLRNHRIPDLPLGVMSCFSSVTSLDLANNLIKTVHPEIGNLTQLRSLDLSENPIAILPLEIGYITNMTSFKIDVEKLMVPPNEISQQGVEGVLEWVKWVADMRRTKDGALSGRSDVWTRFLSLSHTNTYICASQMEEGCPHCHECLHVWSTHM